jgi:hypothetical protein
MPDWPLPTPNGCRHCGQPERDHYRRWTEAAGWHKWAAPADAQRIERMLARRAARLAPKPAHAPTPPDLVLTLSVDTGPLVRALRAASSAARTLSEAWQRSTEAFAREMSDPPTRQTGDTPMAGLTGCVRCDHTGDQHRHNDTAWPGGGCGPNCATDNANLSLAPFEKCLFRCVVPGRTCPNMIGDRA